MLTLQESKSKHFNKQKLLNNVRHEHLKKGQWRFLFYEKGKLKFSKVNLKKKLVT